MTENPYAPPVDAPRPAEGGGSGGGLEAGRRALNIGCGALFLANFGVATFALVLDLVQGPKVASLVAFLIFGGLTAAVAHSLYGVLKNKPRRGRPPRVTPQR